MSFEFESTNFSYPIIRTVVSANEILHLQQIVENLRYTLIDSIRFLGLGLDTPHEQAFRFRIGRARAAPVYYKNAHNIPEIMLYSFCRFAVAHCWDPFSRPCACVCSTAIVIDFGPRCTENTAHTHTHPSNSGGRTAGARTHTSTHVHTPTIGLEEKGSNRKRLPPRALTRNSIVSVCKTLLCSHAHTHHTHAARIAISDVLLQCCDSRHFCNCWLTGCGRLK